MSKICTGQSTRRVSRFMANYHHSFKSLQSAVSNLILKLQLHFSGSLRSEFQDKRLFVYLLSVEIVFRLRPTTKRFPFSFEKCRMSREFCRSFTGSYPENHEFRRPFGLLVWNFGRPRGLIVSASGAVRAALRTRMLGVRSFLRACRPIGSNDGDDEDDKDQFIAISL